MEQYLPGPAGDDSKVLVCGPDPMMKAMVDALQERGFKAPSEFSKDKHIPHHSNILIPGRISHPRDEIFTFQ